MISLPDLADKVNNYGLMQKTFLSMSKAEIELLISAVFSSPDSTVPVDGWAKPIIIDDNLMLKFDCHPKYRWWEPDGQSILETLLELDAPYSVAKKYIGSRGMTEAEYINKTIPF